MSTLECRYIPWRFHYEDRRLVPQRIRADRAGIRIREVLAACASLGGLSCCRYRGCKSFCILVIHSEDMECQTLCRLSADSGKTAQLCYKVLD